LARRLEVAAGDLSLSSYRILAMAAVQAQRSSQLASRLALARPTISGAVDALVERGLLERGEVAGDRRAVTVAITSEGRRVLEQVEERMAESLGAVIER